MMKVEALSVSPKSNGAVARDEHDHDNCIAHVHEVSIRFDNGVQALDCVSLKVAKGEHVAILGASGSGKTTLLKCLAGRLLPHSGRVECQGGVAVIHQDLRLVKQATTLRNVLHGSLGRHSLWRTLIGFPRAEKARAADLLQRVGLAGRMRTRVSRLSGGEQQRVAIARALMQDPCILLADEPIAALDRPNAQRMMALLTDVARERGLTLVTVLHDRALADEFADRTMHLECGRVCPRHYEPMDEIEDHGGTDIRSGGTDLQSVRGVQTESLNHRSNGGSDPQTTIHLPQVQPGDDLEHSPFKSAWRFAIFAIIAVAVYAWAVAGLRITPDQVREAGPGAWGFLKALWPASSEQLASVPWAAVSKSLIETIQMSLIGTTAGVLISAPFAALAARNVGPRFIRSTARMLLNVVRTIPSLIWALFFVAAVGFGPFAGVLALTMYSVGYLTKFFYEAFEAAETGPQEALADVGASGLQRFVHAVWPMSLPVVASSALFMVEYNVRAASVLGIVDAGGIGWWIKHFLDYRNFPAAIACLGMVLVVVIILDACSTRFRAWAVRR